MTTVSPPRALVVGGTGPTGPFIVNGLRERGYTVTIFHRGTHEIPEIPEDVEHIHGDPHFAETIDQALAGRTFDLTIASYGRLRLLAAGLKGRTGRFIGIGGYAAYRGWIDPYRLDPPGMTSPIAETAPVVASEEEQRFGWLIAQSEEIALTLHPTGTVFRYPYVYGPYQIRPREWSFIRRLAHQPSPGGDIERALGDTFDYPAEDRLIGLYRRGQDLLRSVAEDAAAIAWHPYAHPKEAGKQRDQRNR